MFKERLIGLLLGFLVHGTAVPGDVGFIGKYHRDQPVSVVELATVRRVGRLEGNRLYVTQADVIGLALEFNLDLNVQRHNRLNREWAIELSRSAYDPEGTFGFTWDRDKTPAASVLQGGTSLTNILTDIGIGYRHPFSTGTTFEVNLRGNRNRSNNFFASLVPAIESQFEVLIRQDLLRGFGKADAEYDLEISRNNLDLSDQEFRQTVTDVVSQVQDGFWELEYTLQDIEVKEKSLELAQTIYDQNQARLEVGTASRLEVIEAQAEVASRREELIRAQFEYRRAQDRLVKLVTNFEDPRQFQGELVPEGEPPNLEREPEPFNRLLQVAGEFRPEILQADISIANQRVEVDRSRDRLKPSLELVAGYQQFGLGGTEVVRDFSEGFFDPPVVEVIPGGLGDSIGEMFSADFYGYVLGFNLQLPIGNSESRARNAQAQIELNRVELQKQAVRQRVGLEIRDALTQIQMNRERREAAQAAFEAARERVEGEQARFEVGMGTTRQLIEAQRDLLQSASLMVRARTDLIRSQNLLDKVLGMTLKAHSIVLHDAIEANVRRPN